MEYPPNEPLPLEIDYSPEEADVSLDIEQSKPTALVHILTPEFHDLDPEDFADITEDVMARATAKDLQPSLFWSYIRKNSRITDEISAFSYLTPDEGYVSVALTPEEYATASESVGKLAQRIFNSVLAARDANLREQSGDTTLRARSEEDIRAAQRGAMRAVIDRKSKMRALLDERIVPKIELIDKFIEMTEGKNPNLARGTKETVRKRFEELRTTIFDDMLDAVALQRGWTDDMTERAKQIIQKRLYMSTTMAEKVSNFKEMLILAHTYYGYKRALILTKTHEANRYLRSNPDVFADILAIDEQRRREKETRQL